MSEFENKMFEGIHYSRFIASWTNVGGIVTRGGLANWLRTLTINDKQIPEDVIREIVNFATNGKLELQENAEDYIRGKSVPSAMHLRNKIACEERKERYLKRKQQVIDS